MSRQSKGVQLEWINITYRSVGSAVLALVLLVVGGGGYWVYTRHIRPKGNAQGAIKRATSRLHQASILQLDEQAVEIVSNAEVHLNLARSEYDNSKYDDAMIAAVRSESMSLKVITISEGENAQARRVRFSKLEGDVRVKQAGGFSWSSANKSMVLRVGDQVKTSSKSSAEVIYFDGTVTRIQPGSLLEIRDLYEDPVTQVRRVREKLSWGEVHASTQKRNVSGSFHEFTAGKVAARADDQGKFRIKVDEKKRTSVVDVFDGRIEVTAPDRKETVRTGERMRASANGTLSPKEPLPGVPRLVSPSDQRVFIFENPEKEELKLRWQALAGIPRYRLMISDQALFTEPLYDESRDETSAVIAGVPQGSYHWKVAAFSDEGVEGPFSEARSFRVSSQQIRDRTDTEPPRLLVTEFVPIGQMVIINGETEPGATLWVDNNKVEVYDDGSFNAVVRLRAEGLNELLLVAQDTAGNKATVRRNAFVELY